MSLYDPEMTGIIGVLITPKERDSNYTRSITTYYLLRTADARLFKSERHFRVVYPDEEMSTDEDGGVYLSMVAWLKDIVADPTFDREFYECAS